MGIHMLHRLAAALASITTVHAALYVAHESAHCYGGHGGTPVPGVSPMKNVSFFVCEKACDSNANCTAITIQRHGEDWQSPSDCYLRAAVNLTACDYSDKSWSTFKQTAPPPTKGRIVYHLFESKYTGLADKDAGDFKGDTGFIFATFSKFNAGNPEASMEHNIIEMSEVNVTGWGKYEECNAPGAHQMQFSCPANHTEYCCTTHDDKGNQIPSNHTKTQLPGVEVNFISLGPNYGFPGFWFSFPKESENVTWTEKLLRRISGLCLGNAWRKDAGGCHECGASLDKCVADCIQRELLPDGNVTSLQTTWERVFADTRECPDVPFKPASEIGLLVI